jgi:hypothetical protein
VARHPARPISIASFDQVIGLDGLLRNGVEACSGSPRSGEPRDRIDQGGLVDLEAANLTVPSDATK